jgi:hypothetical protein
LTEHILREQCKRTNPQRIFDRIQRGDKEKCERGTGKRARKGKETHKARWNPTTERSADIRTKMALILSNLITDNRKKAEASVAAAARWFREHEIARSVHGTAQNKEGSKRQILNSLMNNDGSETRNTEQMMEIAKTHHESLQARPEMTTEREAAILEVLQNVDDKPNDEQKDVDRV